MLTDVVAMPFSSRNGVPRASDVAIGSPAFLEGVRSLPGVTGVFPASAGISRWYDEPVTAFVEDGPSVQAWVTVAIDRHARSSVVVGMIGAYLRARLSECGFDLIAVKVRVALLD